MAARRAGGASGGPWPAAVWAVGYELWAKAEAETPFRGDYFPVSVILSGSEGSSLGSGCARKELLRYA